MATTSGNAIDDKAALAEAFDFAIGEQLRKLMKESPGRWFEVGVKVRLTRDGLAMELSDAKVFSVL